MRYALMIGTAAALALAVPATGHAQRDMGRRDSAAARMMGPPRGNRGFRGERGPDRARIQRQIRQAFTHAVRTKVGLSEDQMKQLAPINQKYVKERQTLAQSEREVRLQLRAELAKPTPDESTVASLSAQLQQFPRQRLDLNAAEDKDLAGIMTPVQLAKYRALQERVQRQLESMRPAGGIAEPPLSLGDSTRTDRGQG